MNAPSNEAAVVEMRGITRRFGDTLALDGVSFDLRPGEIHALLGENGAGKSTLMRLLAGELRPHAGEIRLRGEPVTFRSARDAAAHGIGIVHQHFMLVENLTVAENLALALPEQTPFWLPRRHLAEKALAQAAAMGWTLDPDAYVWQLPVGAQQRLEIVKALAREARVLVFDEPTAVLAPTEVEELFAVLTRLRDEGRSLVFISHKLGEVLRLCDRVTVLRRGRNAGTVSVSDTDAVQLAHMMLGEAERSGTGGASAPSIIARPGTESARDAAPALAVQNLYVRDDRSLPAVRGVSFAVHPGEIFGIAGVDGNGQAELAEAVVGLRRAERGRVGRPGAVGFVPQDRQRQGLALGMSVRENLILALHRERGYRWGPFLDLPRLNAAAGEMVARYDIRLADVELPAAALSGGNQQKIVIARALYQNPALIVAVNPTRGLDVGATRYVHDQLRAQRERGAAILLISTELEEVLALSDRLAVLYEGTIAGEGGPETPRETLGLWMGGRRAGEAA